jgi:hypothetical protein
MRTDTDTGLPTLPADLTTATPPDLDAHFAELSGREQAIQSRITAACELARVMADEKPMYLTRARIKFWETSDEQAIARARELAATTERKPAKPWRSADSVHTAVERYDDAMADLYEIRREQAPLVAEWTRRGGWSRFFEVDANNGHIHSSMTCQTCNRNGKLTRFGWHPELSGLTEADAVEALGPKLCTVCFPSAPLEWTFGTPKPAACENAPVKEGTRTRSYGIANTRYGDCTQCAATRIQINSNGRLRRHKPVPA